MTNSHRFRLTHHVRNVPTHSSVVAVSGDEQTNNNNNNNNNNSSDCQDEDDDDEDYDERVTSSRYDSTKRLSPVSSSSSVAAVGSLSSTSRRGGGEDRTKRGGSQPFSKKTKVGPKLATAAAEDRQLFPCIAFSKETYRDLERPGRYYRCFANCLGRDVFIYEYEIRPIPQQQHPGIFTNKSYNRDDDDVDGGNKTTNDHSERNHGGDGMPNTAGVGRDRRDHGDDPGPPPRPPPRPPPSLSRPSNRGDDAIDPAFHRRQWYTSDYNEENFFACTFAMQSRRRRRNVRPPGDRSPLSRSTGRQEGQTMAIGDGVGDDEDDIDNEDQILCVGGAKGNILIIDVRTGELLMELVGNSGYILDLKASPKPPHDDRRRRRPPPPPPRQYRSDGTKTVVRPTTPIDYNYPSNTTNLLCSASTSEVRVWNLDSYACVCIFGGDPGGHHGDVNAVAWHPSGHKIASGGHDATIRVWTLDGNATQSGRRIQEAVHASQLSRIVVPTTTTASATTTGVSRSNNRSQFHSVCERFPVSVHPNVHDDMIDCVEWVGDLLLSKSCHGEIKLWMPLDNPNRFVTPDDDDDSDDGNGNADDDDGDDSHNKAKGDKKDNKDLDVDDNNDDDDGSDGVPSTFIPIKTYTYTDAGDIYFVRFALGGGGSPAQAEAVSDEQHKTRGQQPQPQQQQKQQGRHGHQNHDPPPVTLAVGNKLGHVHLWNVEDLDATRHVQKLNGALAQSKSASSGSNLGLPALMRGLAFSPDSNTLVGCDDAYNVFRWDRI